MSVTAALRFIERLASDLRLQQSVREVTPRGDLAAIAAVASRAGFELDATDLQEAFVIDWKLRRRFYAALPDSGAGRRPDRAPKPGSPSR